MDRLLRQGFQTGSCRARRANRVCQPAGFQLADGGVDRGFRQRFIRGFQRALQSRNTFRRIAVQRVRRGEAAVQLFERACHQLDARLAVLAVLAYTKVERCLCITQTFGCRVDGIVCGGFVLRRRFAICKHGTHQGYCRLFCFAVGCPASWRVVILLRDGSCFDSFMKECCIGSGSGNQLRNCNP